MNRKNWTLTIISTETMPTKKRIKTIEDGLFKEHLCQNSSKNTKLNFCSTKKTFLINMTQNLSSKAKLQ